MVNFKVKLENEKIEEWRSHYIDYKELESYMHASRRERSQPLKKMQPLLEDCTSDFEAAFILELKRVEGFYVRKLNELKNRLRIQREQVTKAGEITDIDVVDEKVEATGTLRSTESLKRSMLVFYRQVKYLQSFCILNYSGFVKILKKHHKVSRKLLDSLGDDKDESLPISPRRLHSSHSFDSKHLVRQHPDSKKNSIDSPNLSINVRQRRTRRANSVGQLAAQSASLRYKLDSQSFVAAVKERGEVSVMIRTCESIYAAKFCSGDVVQAQAELLSKQGTGDFDWRPFHLGYRFGACLILTFWILWDAIVDTLYRPPKSANWVRSIFPIYRGYFCLVLMIWLAGTMMFIWQKHRVNYLYIFELDPRRAPTLEQVYLQATNATIIVMANFLLYYKVLRGDFPGWIPAPYIPILLILITIVWCIWNFNSVKRVFMAIYEVIALLWLGGQVNFLTAFVADVFTSMVKVFVDIAFTSCVMFTGAWLDSSGEATQSRCAHNWYFKRIITVLVTVLPLYFRFIQNIKLYRKYGKPFPFLVNAMKYVVSLAVSLFSSLHGTTDANSEAYLGIYLFLTIIATIYSYVWDVAMDWGLGRRLHGGLRSRLMYGRRWVYWCAIFIDLFGRLLWIITLMPFNDVPIPYFPDVLAPFLAGLELCRRAMWGCFRLENEHLNNTGYRRIDGPVPDHFDSV
ncbi:hypothetical protein AAMO2058_000415500 [Amorphochlora amoebiformis]